MKAGWKKHWTPSYIMISLLLVGFAVICMMPFWYVFVSSFSDPLLIKEGQFKLLPSGLSLDAYKMLFHDIRFFQGLRITIIRTAVGTIIALAVQTTGAYALSKARLRGRRFFMMMVIFTLLFNGGIIPTYLVMQDLNLIDTIWALILPMAFSPWNTILLINFFTALPASIEESAKLDGANDLVVFWKLALPLSHSAVASILLFIAVRHWNELMDGVIYINNSVLKPMQVYLIELVKASQRMGAMESDQYLPTVSIQTAVIFASCLPIIMLYPFLQRFFVKGIMVGAVKG